MLTPVIDSVICIFFSKNVRSALLPQYLSTHKLQQDRFFYHFLLKIVFSPSAHSFNFESRLLLTGHKTSSFSSPVPLPVRFPRSSVPSRRIVQGRQANRHLLLHTSTSTSSQYRSLPPIGAYATAAHLALAPNTSTSSLFSSDTHSVCVSLLFTLTVWTKNPG
jgi:hypothetical protein